MIKQSAEDASIGKRGAASLPEANGGSAATGEADSKKDEPLRRKKRLKKKGKSFKLTILKKRGEKIKGRLLRKSSTTEDVPLHMKLGGCGRGTCRIQWSVQNVAGQT